jgi:Icc-related predicted phosphoesterase
MTKIVSLSDLHGHLPEIPECDLVLISGDLWHGQPMDYFGQMKWLNGEFRDWANNLNCKKIVFCAGNHDFLFQDHKEFCPKFDKKDKVSYLEDDFLIWNNIKIYGVPWQLYFFEWAFNAPQENGEEFLTHKFNVIPDDCDILITHGPPKGILDIAQKDTRAGSDALLNYIKQKQPKLVVFGHLHYCGGMKEMVDNCLCVNAAILDNNYKFRKIPEIIELPIGN